MGPLNRIAPWGWLASQSGHDMRRLVALLDAVGSPGVWHFGVGEPGWGVDGFCDSYAHAQAAHRVGARFAHPVTRYDTVALEALTLTDEHAARRFARRKLGSLLDGGHRSGVLLATLEVYLDSAMNAAAAAARLRVSDRTVAHRIRTIEDVLGRSVMSRSAELALALRLRRLDE
jgi:DNA-binding PucR family transcriptional regulator